MAKRERLQRQDPKRTGPIRNATNYFHDSRSWTDEAPDGGRRPDQHEQSGSLEDVVTDGVKLGYKVIEEYLRQGQRTAQWIRNTSHEQDGSKGGNTEELLENVLRLYKDMTGIWVDALSVIVRSPGFLSWLTGTERGNRAEPSQNEHGEPSPANGTATKIAIEILSVRRAQVTLDLGGTHTHYPPLVHALYASDPSIPPLTGISFRLERKSMVPILQLKIPAKQPAGMYTGVVVDRQTNDPRGTLCVRVLA